jgi:hypothetical protein
MPSQTESHFHCNEWDIVRKQAFFRRLRQRLFRVTQGARPGSVQFSKFRPVNSTQSVGKKLAMARTPVPESLPPATLRLLREWLANDDGRAGERAAAAILRVIERKQLSTVRT